MKPTSLFAQIAMIIIAVVVVIMYIKPAIAEIKQTQDSTELYKEEIRKVSDVNRLLSQKASTVDSVPLSSKQALYRYVPDEIDDLMVLKDIQNILTSLSLEPLVLSYGQTEESNNSYNGDESMVIAEPLYTPHTFSVEFESSYQDFKLFLSLIETTDYLLEIGSLTVKPNEAGLVSVEAMLNAYTRTVENEMVDEGNVGDEF